jgi:hypothetical protein
MNCEVGCQIGETMGEVEEVDITSDGGNSEKHIKSLCCGPD